MSSSVAVIDIGSNSIKLLVAAPGPGGRPVAVAMRTLDARISAGISQAKPRLGREGMERGLAAVKELLHDVAASAPKRIVIVATSAVRDAENGIEFQERIRTATGHRVRILSGQEEAAYIGRGLACDPTLSAIRDFYLFDLGGGSLECLVFRSRRAVQEVSLPLGCVRLTEKFVGDPTAPIRGTAAAAIDRHVGETFGPSGFSFTLGASATAVGTGGTLTNVRAVIGAEKGVALEKTDSLVPVKELIRLFAKLGGLPLAERRQVPGLPPARADVFPAALATLISVAHLGRFDAYRHSFYNLRWGVAAEALQAAG